MKKVLLFFILALSSSIIFSQSLQLFDHDGNEFVNGQNTEITVNFADWESVSPELFAFNQSNQDIRIKIRFHEISAPEGTTNNFCGLGTCFGPGLLETPNAAPVPAGQSIGEGGVFSSHYQHNGVEGIAVLRYTFFNIDNLNDTISVSFTFNGNPVTEPSLQLFDHDGNEFVNGQNTEIAVNFADWETVSPELFAFNKSNEDVHIKIRFHEVSAPAGTTNNFCGLGTCFGPGLLETPNSDTVFAGQSIGDEGVFSSHYQHNGVEGVAVLRYTFFNINNLNDTISVTFTFNGNPVVEVPIQLFHADGTEIVNGQNIEMNIDDLNREYETPYLYVKNNTLAGMNMVCRRDVVDTVTGSMNYFCANGVCLPPTSDVTRELLVPAGVTVDELNAFYAHYTANNHSGISVLRYTYYNVDNANDSLSFTITYDGSVGINELSRDSQISAYPNPATSNVIFSLPVISTGNAALVLYNAMGVEVLRHSLNYNESQTTLNLSNMAKGVYLFRVENSETYSKTSKLVIK